MESRAHGALQAQRLSVPWTPGTCGRLEHVLQLPAVGGLDAAAPAVVERLLHGAGAGGGAHGEAGRGAAQPGQQQQEARQPGLCQHRRVPSGAAARRRRLSHGRLFSGRARPARGVPAAGEPGPLPSPN